MVLCNNFGLFLAFSCVLIGNLVLVTADNGLWQNLPLKCKHCKDVECTELDEKTCPQTTDDCMTVFKKDGKIEARGCTSVVLKRHESFCKTNKDNCFSCSSNNCNVAANMKDYVTCISCNSMENSLCATEPKSGKFATKKCHKSCMVALYSSVQERKPVFELVRGCLDDKELTDRKLCEQGKGTCKSCTGENCNAFSFPENRLQCYQCNAGSCEDSKSTPCPLYSEEDKCSYLYSPSGKFLSAQCKSSLRSPVVQELIMKNQFVVCDGKDCNSPTNLPKIQTCFVCNSTTDPDCAVNPTNIKSKAICTEKPNTQCYTQVQEGLTFRGCLSSLTNLDLLECTLRKNVNCRTCFGNDCNKEVFPSNRLKCHRCDSKNDQKCTSKPESPSYCPKYVEGDSCVVHYTKEGSLTQRDCQSEKPCDGKDNLKCRICSGESCNVVDLKKANGAAGIYLAIGAVLVMISHLFL